MEAKVSKNMKMRRLNFSFDHDFYNQKSENPYEILDLTNNEWFDTAFKFISYGIDNESDFYLPVQDEGNIKFYLPKIEIFQSEYGEKVMFRVFPDEEMDKFNSDCSHNHEQSFSMWKCLDLSVAQIKFGMPGLTKFKKKYSSPCGESECPCNQKEMCFRGALCSIKEFQEKVMKKANKDIPLDLTINFSIKFYMSKDLSLKDFEQLESQRKARDQILERDLYPDFIIECKGKEFPCHKSVLASQSSVFAAILASKNKESLANRMTNRMTLDEDFSVESCDAFLNYLYKRGMQFPKDPSIVVDLLKSGYKYEIKHLEKAMCEIIKEMKQFNAPSFSQKEVKNKFDIPSSFQLYEFCFNLKIEKFHGLVNVSLDFFKHNLADFMTSDQYKQLLMEDISMAKDLAMKVSNYEI